MFSGSSQKAGSHLWPSVMSSYPIHCQALLIWPPKYLLNLSFCLYLYPYHFSLSYHQPPPELSKLPCNWYVCIYFDFPQVHFPMHSSVLFSKACLMLTYFSFGDAFSALHTTYHGGNFTVLSVVLQLLSAFPCRLSALRGGGDRGSVCFYLFFSHPQPSVWYIVHSRQSENTSNNCTEFCT